MSEKILKALSEPRCQRFIAVDEFRSTARFVGYFVFVLTMRVRHHLAQCISNRRNMATRNLPLVY